MKMIIVLALLFCSNSYGIPSSDTLELAQKTVSHNWLNLTRYMVACGKAADKCKLTSEEKELLRKIAFAMPDEYQSGKGLFFRSGRENPGLFDLDDQGQPRSAVTGSTIGSPIYINTDYLIKSDPDHPSTFVPIEVIDAIGILVHEVGHHQGILEHTPLDLLGSKVKRYALALSAQGDLSHVGLSDIRFFLHSPHDQILDEQKISMGPMLIFRDTQNLISISEPFALSGPCTKQEPTTKHLFLGNPHWGTVFTKNNDGTQTVEWRSDADLICGFKDAEGHDDMNFYRIDVHVFLKLKTDSTGTHIIDRHWSFRRFRHMASDIFFPTHVAQMKLVQQKMSTDGVWRIETEVSNIIQHTLTSCRAYLTADVFSLLPEFDHIHVPVDSCEIQALEPGRAKLIAMITLPPSVKAIQIRIESADLSFSDYPPQAARPTELIETMTFNRETSYLTPQLVSAAVTPERDSYEIGDAAAVTLKFKSKTLIRQLRIFSRALVRGQKLDTWVTMQYDQDEIKQSLVGQELTVTVPIRIFQGLYRSEEWRFEKLELVDSQLLEGITDIELPLRLKINL